MFLCFVWYSPITVSELNECVDKLNVSAHALGPIEEFIHKLRIHVFKMVLSVHENIYVYIIK